MKRNISTEVTLTKGCMVGGEVRKPGDKVQVTEAEAHYLRVSGFAEKEDAAEETVDDETEKETGDGKGKGAKGSKTK